MAMNTKRTEAEILAAVLVGLAERRIVAWRSNTGAARAPNGRVIRFGLKGAADIIGLLPGGRFLAIECKAPLGRLSMEQLRFGHAISKAGGCYLVARDAQTCLDTIDHIISNTPAHVASENKESTK